MGAWGGGLFESDHVMDFIGDMTTDLGIDMTWIGEPEDFKFNDESSDSSDQIDKDDLPKVTSVKDAREHLNKGNFTRVFNKYKKESTSYDFLINANHACVIVAAKAMSVGADISDEQRDFLRGVYKKCGLFKEGIEQMGRALEEYQNGTPYELIDADRTDYEEQQAFDQARSGAIGGFSLLNYMGPRYFEEDKPTPDFTQSIINSIRRKNNEPAYFPGAPVLRKCQSCNKLAEQIPEGLKFCGKCKKVMYCSRECQKQDWKAVHKKFCKAFAAMPEPPMGAKPAS